MTGIARSHRDSKNPGPHGDQPAADAEISRLVGTGEASLVSEEANLPTREVKTGSAPASVPEGQTPPAAPAAGESKA